VHLFYDGYYIWQSKKTVPVNVPIHAAATEIAGPVWTITARTVQKQTAEKMVLTVKGKKAPGKP